MWNDAAASGKRAAALTGSVFFFCMPNHAAKPTGRRMPEKIVPSQNQIEMRRQRENNRGALELRQTKIELGVLCSDDGSARLTSGS